MHPCRGGGDCAARQGASQARGHQVEMLPGAHPALCFFQVAFL